MTGELELRVASTWDGEPIAEGEQVVFRITLAADAWRIRVDAPFHGDPPPPGDGGSTDGLWDYEVAELFVAGRGEGEDPEPRYLELELSPHGHYLLLRLHGVRQAVESLRLAAFSARVEGGRWRGEALLDRRLLPPPPHRVNAFALHGTGEARRHLAMTPVPGPAPDFHRLEAFEPIERWLRRVSEARSPGERGGAGGLPELGRDPRERLRLLAAAVESAANAIFITDSSGRIAYLNPAFETLTGFAAGEALGENPRILSSGRQGGEFYAEFWRTIAAGKPWSGRVVNRRKDGAIYTVLQTVTPIVGDGGEVTHYVAIHEDVTAQVKAEQQIRHLAEYDYLTDLPNRYTLNSRLQQETSRIARHGGRAAVLMLDLDHFKSINDNFGHATGDDLLVAVAGRLRTRVRASDTLARLGGDEFAVLMVSLESLESAAEMAARLNRALLAPFELEAQKIYTSASIGIAVSPPEQADPEELLRQADLALYRVKEEGRNGYRFFAEEMHQEIQLRMALGHDLHGALERDELFLEYQPQVDLRSRRLVGVEALLRWNHPGRGVVRPADFVPIAESNGLVVPIGDWVLREACGQVRAWQESGLPVVPVAVNLSAVQLRRRDFVDAVFAILEETGLPAGYLELELTETILMESTPGLEESVRRLSEGGVRIALDDFGKGYSSLDYLRRFPLDKLKIDRSFVRDVEDSRRDATILGAVISLAAQLDLHVIAEGIGPTSRHLDYLLEEGCDEAQGFYFAEPLPADSIARLLAEGSDRVQPPLAGG